MNVNKEVLSFSLTDVFEKDKLVFGEKDGLKGTLTIQNADKTNLPSEVLTLRNMVLAGEGDARCSSALRAWLKYRIDDFKEGDNPLNNYEGLVKFVMPIIHSFKGTKKDNFSYIVGWLNDPRLVDQYTRDYFSYHFYGLLPIGTPPDYLYRHKRGPCYAWALFIDHCLYESGHESYIYDMYGPHKFNGYKNINDSLWYVLDNGRMSGPGGIIGPFKTERELTKNFSCVRF